MQLKFISEFAELETNREQWDSVAGSFPFFRWNWMANWFRHLGQQHQLAVLVAIDTNGDWQGIAPWFIDSSKPLSRKLRLLGSGDACSDYVGMICGSRCDEKKFMTLATDWLVENIANSETLGRIDVVELEGIQLADPNSQYLCELLDANGMHGHTTELEGGWAVDLPGTWQELNSRFSKSMRRKTKKAVKRVSDPATTILSTRDQPFEKLWPIFTRLHQQRRKMLGQSGCFASESFERFLRSATQGLVEESRAEILVIMFEDRPLATMLMLNDDETVYTYQTGMDVELLNLEPGYQICHLAIKRSIDQGFKRFDFLRGDEPYKARWNTTRIPIARTRYIPRSPVARIKHGLWMTGRSIKHLMAGESLKAELAASTGPGSGNSN